VSAKNVSPQNVPSKNVPPRNESPRAFPAATLVPLLLALVFAAAPAAAGVDARILRQPDVSATEIAFVYAGDVWTVPKDGGTARRLSTPPGEESFPRFSPDGSRLAFSANYDGNVDLYVVPAAGGLPVRVTHHPDADRLLDWTPDGASLLYASPMTAARGDRFNQLFVTAAGGGLPERLPVPYGELGALSADGRTLAYTPTSRAFRTWKRYRGGWASEIWLFDLDDLSARRVAVSDANDGHPMWHGSRLYFLSDRGENRRANLWAVDVDGGEPRQVTHFDRYDVHFPSIGPEEIVFENGGRLYLMDLDDEEVREVEVEVVTDRSTLRPRVEKVAELIRSFDLSPSGKRALFEARGEVFTVPAEHGVVRDLTRTSRHAERYPAWSPDGQWIAYLSDRSGEYELTLRPADGSGEERTLTAMGPGFRYRLFWSPDSSKIAFVDQAMGIHYYDLEAEELVEVDRGLYMYQDTLRSFRPSWSPDGRWLAYHRTVDTRTSAVFLYDTAEGALHQVTSGFYQGSNPTFGAGGDYLFLRWARELTPIYSDFQNSWVYANSTRLAAVPLRRDVPSPLAPRNDEEAGIGEEKGKEGDGGDGDGDAEDPEPVAIDLEGFESRLVVLPPGAGNYGPLAAAPGKLLYLRQPRTGAGAGDGAGPFGGGPGDLVFYELEAREEKTVLEGVDEYVLAAGGDKVLVRRGEDFAIVDLAPGQKLEKPLRTAELEMTVDPAAEWRQLFDDAWRFERDYFYDPRLHGVDWQEMRERYGALLDHAVTRWDVNYVLGEMLGELNASHVYRGGGDAESAPERGVGLLGADFASEGGFYRFAEVLELPPGETEARSPLLEPGVEVAEGDYLLAVNGVPVDAGEDPWAAFQGLADQTVSLTVNHRPTFDGAREVLVRTLESERRLRNLAWIAANRRRVEEATGGRAGYVYVPSTGLDGQGELVRQFIPQLTRDALIVDERFNSGGQIPDRFIELLNRPLYNYWGVRSGVDLPWPPSSHQGPKVMLINGWAGSGGDLFPFYFREAGLGPLIGRRTWGGLIGISGNPPLIDGGGVSAPSFAIYSLDGEWIIEGYGVEPDVEVIDDPAAMARGEDPQLERAIEEVLRRLEESPPRRPEHPAPADRSGV